MEVIKGVPNNINKGIIGIITKERMPLYKRNSYIIVCNGKKANYFGYAGIISAVQNLENIPQNKPCVTAISEQNMRNLQNGDIVKLNPDGQLFVLWKDGSISNSIMITEECNCNCIMCPQPPKRDNEYQHKINKRLLSLLDPEKTSDICLTGGEPTIKSESFIEILKMCKNRFPETHLVVLSNGITFQDINYVKNIIKIGKKKLKFCISLNADTDELHDRISRTKGNFTNTVKGIQNLAKFYQTIELRFVISKLNHKRIIAYANFIYRNFPFISHVAFMGLEITGNADKNIEKLWIDPLDFQHELRTAVIELQRRFIPVSIYNIPLCLLPEDIWNFSRQSISLWKNEYLPDCGSCKMKSTCCGIFTTSSFQSTNIYPIQ